MKTITINIFYLILFLSSCKTDDETTPVNLNYKQEMRDFVVEISHYSKAIKPTFIIIPQNGIELATANGEEHGNPAKIYLDAIDGNGQEDLFYGYDEDDKSTPVYDNNYLQAFLDISKNSGNKILVTDYCSTHSKMDDSYSKNSNKKYISFAADRRELNKIPDYPNPIFSENNKNISSLNDIQNFLYLINPESFSTKNNFINAVTATNYDLLIMDLFFNDGSKFTIDEIDQLKSKANGCKRLVIAYMSVGEAEDYRYYWNSSWNTNKPDWLDRENPDWKGNFKVKYWDKEWQKIIVGNDESYLKKIIDVNFDGVYLDIIDAFEYFE